MEEFHPLEQPVPLTHGLTGTLWSEVVHLEGATALADYPDGSPAITRRQGAFYLSTRLDDAGYAWVLRQAGLPMPDAPVELVRRGGTMFAINHTDRAHTVAGPGGAPLQLEPGQTRTYPAHTS